MTRRLTLAVAVLCAATTGRPLADDPPVVRVLPSVPVRDASVTVLDGPLPASREFIVEVPASDAGPTLSGVLEIWPAGDCASPSGPQHYRIALVPTADSPPKLRARVPPLQIRQRYCVQVSRNVGLSERQAQELVTAFAEDVRRQLLARPPRDVARVEVFQDAMARLVRERGFVGDPRRLGSTLFRIFEASDAPKAYRDFLAADARLGAEREHSPDRERKEVRAEAAALPDLLAGPPSLAPAAAEVLKAYRANPFQADLARLPGALDDVAAAGRPAEDVAAWRESLARVQRLNASERDRQKGLQDATRAASESYAALGAALTGAVDEMKTVPSSVLRQPLAVSTFSAEPGEGTTPSAGNYASVDVGVAVAFPTGGGTGEPWFLPYIGINLYFTPVEREVPFDKLAGSGWQRLVLQRLSLTAGFSLSNPGIPGRQVGTLIFGKYPMVAAGYRLTPYVRFAAGAFLYSLSDANPALNASSIEAAPFAGISLDLDLIHFITNGIASVK